MNHKELVLWLAFWFVVALISLLMHLLSKDKDGHDGQE